MPVSVFLFCELLVCAPHWIHEFCVLFDSLRYSDTISAVTFDFKVISEKPISRSASDTEVTKSCWKETVIHVCFTRHRAAHGIVRSECQRAYEHMAVSTRRQHQQRHAHCLQHACAVCCAHRHAPHLNAAEACLAHSKRAFSVLIVSTHTSACQWCFCPTVAGAAGEPDLGCAG